MSPRRIDFENAEDKQDPIPDVLTGPPPKEQPPGRSRSEIDKILGPSAHSPVRLAPLTEKSAASGAAAEEPPEVWIAAALKGAAAGRENTFVRRVTSAAEHATTINLSELDDHITNVLTLGIPHRHVPDGCHERAHAVYRYFRERKLAAFKLFVSGYDSEGRPGGLIAPYSELFGSQPCWKFHVAVVVPIRIGAADRSLRVIDLSFRHSALEISTWIDIFAPRQLRLDLDLRSGEAVFPTTARVDGHTPPCSPRSEVCVDQGLVGQAAAVERRVREKERPPTPESFEAAVARHYKALKKERQREEVSHPVPPLDVAELLLFGQLGAPHDT